MTDDDAPLFECDGKKADGTGCGYTGTEEEVVDHVNENAWDEHGKLLPPDLILCWGAMEVGGEAWHKFHFEGIHPMDTIIEGTVGPAVQNYVVGRLEELANAREYIVDEETMEGFAWTADDDLAVSTYTTTGSLPEPTTYTPADTATTQYAGPKVWEQLDIDDLRSLYDLAAQQHQWDAVDDIAEEIKTRWNDASGGNMEINTGQLTAALTTASRAIAQLEAARGALEEASNQVAGAYSGSDTGNAAKSIIAGFNTIRTELEKPMAGIHTAGDALTQLIRTLQQ